MNDIFPSKVFVENAAPKARHMKARGKCEARRPWYTNQTSHSPERGVIPRALFRPFRPERCVLHKPGATRFALAPGFHISAPLARITYTSDC